MSAKAAFWVLWGLGFAGFSTAAGVSGEVPPLLAGTFVGIDLAVAVCWLVDDILERSR